MANTRIFSFGIGTDLNAVFLDQIAEKTRALSHYVSAKENLEIKIASFFDKINKPVLANLQLTTTAGVRLTEVYPPQLPDLFHGDQLVILARYEGSGHAAITLNGKIGNFDKQFVYELNFARQADGKPFVEELWARRKVGYLLDQIRINGEKKELVDAVVSLATNYGITTPYTSYLIMPDTPLQLASAGSVARGAVPAALDPSSGFGGQQGGRQSKLADFAREVQKVAGELAKNRGDFQDRLFRQLSRDEGAGKSDATPAEREALELFAEAKRMKGTFDQAYFNFRNGRLRQNQVSKLGVDLAVCTNILKCQSRLQANAIQRVANRNCMEIGGVWIDEAFTAKTPTLSIKAQSDAYFQILERQPQMKEVFQLGNHVVWITPNGTGLVIDTTDGKDKMSDREIDLLFASK